MKLALIFIAILLLTEVQPGLGVLEKIECRYFVDPLEGYSCELFITNLNGWDNFTAIDGTHVGSYQDSDVITIRRNLASYTTNIPSIICNKFRNLATLIYANDFIREVGDEAFSGCTNLFHLVISNNEIESISPNAFQNNFGLSLIFMEGNSLTDLPRDLFASPQLIMLHLDRNDLHVLHFDTFGQHSSFTHLRVSNNMIREFDERLIDNSGLRDIEIRDNICANADINDPSPNRDQLRNVLRNCFDNYRDRLN